MTKTKILERLQELLEQDHGGCDETTCSLSVAMSHGYWMHAFDLWSGSGASDSEFDKLYTKVSTYVRKESRKEADLMCKEVSHTECVKCGSIIWEIEWCDGYCSSCGKRNNVK